MTPDPDQVGAALRAISAIVGAGENPQGLTPEWVEEYLRKHEGAGAEEAVTVARHLWGLDIETERPDPLVDYQWEVRNCAYLPVWIMLESPTTGLVGSVRDPSPEEWEKAYHAPSNPYPWPEPWRVVLHKPDA